MKLLILFASCLFLLKSVFLNPIIGGYEVGRLYKTYPNVYKVDNGGKKYPYMVRVFVTESVFYESETDDSEDEELVPGYSCGGTIIKKNIVLTAGHCVSRKLKTPKILVQAGILDLEKEENYVLEIEVLRHIIHPDFNEDDALNDIAILVLKSNIEFNKKIDELEFDPSNKNLNHKIGFVLGWGLTEHGIKSTMLKKTELRVITTAECKRYEENADLTDGEFCAIADDKKSTACEGDSGGPLLIDGKLEGIISSNSWIETKLSNGKIIELCDPKKPTIFVRLSKYRTWVLNILSQYTTKSKTLVNKCKKHSKTLILDENNAEAGCSKRRKVS